MRKGTAHAAALAAALALLAGCEEGPKIDFDAKVRPDLNLLVLTGPAAIDSSYDRLIKRPTEIPVQVRAPLIGLHELTKGSDFQRDAAVTATPLRSLLSAAPCAGKGRCPGRPELAEMLRQAGIDVAPISALTAGAGAAAALAETEAALAARGVVAVPEGGATVRDVGGAKVGFATASVPKAGAGGAAGELAGKALHGLPEKPDVTVVSVELGAGLSPGERRAALDAVGDAAKPDVLLGYFHGPFEGVEVKDGRVVFHNLGPVLTGKASGDRESSFVFRLHFDAKGVAWGEGHPIHLANGKSRVDFIEDGGRAVARMLELSKGARGVTAEFGRVIVETGR